MRGAVMMLAGAHTYINIFEGKVKKELGFSFFFMIERSLSRFRKMEISMREDGWI